MPATRSPRGKRLHHKVFFLRGDELFPIVRGIHQRRRWNSTTTQEGSGRHSADGQVGVARRLRMKASFATNMSSKTNACRHTRRHAKRKGRTWGLKTILRWEVSGPFPTSAQRRRNILDSVTQKAFAHINCVVPFATVRSVFYGKSIIGNYTMTNSPFHNAFCTTFTHLLFLITCKGRGGSSPLITFLRSYYHHQCFPPHTPCLLPTMIASFSVLMSSPTPTTPPHNRATQKRRQNGRNHQGVRRQLVHDRGGCG